MMEGILDRHHRRRLNRRLGLLLTLFTLLYIWRNKPLHGRL